MSLEDFKLKFSASDILPEKSGFALHRRPLQNADNMVKKGLYKTAQEVYTRILSKIHEPEARAKLQSNIEELSTVIQTKSLDEPLKEKERNLQSGLKELTENLAESIQEKIEELEKAAQDFRESSESRGSHEFHSPVQDSGNEAKPDERGENQQRSESSPGTIRESEESKSSTTNSPLIQNEFISIKNEEVTSSHSTDQGMGSQGMGSSESGNQILNLSGGSGSGTGVVGGAGGEAGTGSGSGSITSIQSGLNLPEPESVDRKAIRYIAESVREILDKQKSEEVSQKESETREKETKDESQSSEQDKEKDKKGKKSSKVKDSPYKKSKATEETEEEEVPPLPFPSLPNLPRRKISESDIPGLYGDTLGILPGKITGDEIPFHPINQLLGKLYFSEEWQKFKDLPIKDRRRGEERRKQERDLPRGVKQNRRSGIERRKFDLFKEREKFLEKWEKEGRLEPIQSVDEQMLPFPGDLSPGSFPEEFELLKIDLPDPADKKISPTTPVDQHYIPQFPIPKEDLTDELKDLDPAANEEFVKSFDPFSELPKIDLPTSESKPRDKDFQPPKREISGEISVINLKNKAEAADETPYVPPENLFKETDFKFDDTIVQKFTPEEEKLRELFKIELPEPVDITKGEDALAILAKKESGELEEGELPDVEVVDGDLGEIGDQEIPEITEPEKEPEQEKMIHGILELKPPEIDDAPFLTLTYDFSKIPHAFKLSKNYSIMEYSYYKYKPMLMKAQEFARRKMLKNALNYYRVIKSQNIPPELKNMINRNIMDITEFLEKFIMSKGN